MNGQGICKIWRGFDERANTFAHAPSIRKVCTALKSCFRRYPLYAKRFRRSNFGKRRNCPMRGLWHRALARFDLHTRDDNFYLRGNDGLYRVYKTSHNYAINRSHRNHRRNVRKRRFRELSKTEEELLSRRMATMLVQRSRSKIWQNRSWTPGQWMQWWQRNMFKINRSWGRQHVFNAIRTIIKADLLPRTHRKEVVRPAPQTQKTG